MEIISMKNISLKSVSMKSVSMAGGDNEPEIKPLVFYDVLVSDGAAYINLGVKPTQTDRYDFCLKADEYGSTKGIFGIQGTGTNSLTLLTRTTDSQTKYSFRFRQAASIEIQAARKIMEYNTGYIDLPNDKANIEGIETSPIVNNGYTPMSTIDFYLFGANANPIRKTKSSFKFFAISRNGEYAMYLLPCKCYGVCGMYDIINKVFYGNSNSEGEFSVEGEGYEMDLTFYGRLKGDGTAYIEADNKFYKDGRKVVLTSISTGNSFAYDTYIAYANNVSVLYRRYGQCIQSLLGQNSGTNSLVIGNPSAGAQMKFSITFNGSTYELSASVNGEDKGSITGNTTLESQPLRIFSSMSSGESSRVNSIAIIENGVTIKHLLPCLYNGDAGMFDLIGLQFYGNANTSGSFTVE